MTILTVKNLIPRQAFLYHTPVAAVSAEAYLTICQLNDIDDDNDDDDDDDDTNMEMDTHEPNNINPDNYNYSNK